MARSHIRVQWLKIRRYISIVKVTYGSAHTELPSPGHQCQKEDSPYHLSKIGSCWSPSCSSSGTRSCIHTLALGSRSGAEVWKGTWTKGRIKLIIFRARAGRGSAQGSLLWAQKCRQVLLFLCWVLSTPSTPGAGILCQTWLAYFALFWWSSEILPHSNIANLF